jgi:hypothetical protein
MIVIGGWGYTNQNPITIMKFCGTFQGRTGSHVPWRAHGMPYNSAREQRSPSAGVAGLGAVLR